MSAFIPVVRGKLIQATEDYTVSGARLYAKPIPVGLAIVTLKSAAAHTSVRSDTSGSQSHADEFQEAGRVLVHPRQIPREDDLLEINGQTYRVVGVRDVYAMNGRIDHYQVELSTWASA